MYADGNATDFPEEPTGTAAAETDDERRGLYALLLPLLLVVLIITTNGLSLAAFAVEKRLRGYNNYFIINLTISDFLFGFLLIVTAIHSLLSRSPLPNNIGCRLFYGAFFVIQNVSNLIVIAICIDRHRATYDPIGHFTTRSKRKAIYANAAVWVVSFLFWFSFATIPDFVLDYNNGPSCFLWYYLNPIAHIVPFFTRFIIPFVVILILYVRIFTKIMKTSGRKHIDKEFGGDLKQSSGQANSDGDGDKKQRPQSTAESGGQKVAKRESESEVRRATKTLLFIIIAFFITWCPISIVSVIYSIEPALVPSSWIHLVPGWLVYVNSLLNPICYVVSQPLFRKTVFGLICHPTRYCRG
ncbi:beta-2 adrenergic receptor-like [Lytechinus pictus]|uniref:beta-2 adrenergic receptor-like n=1 Tax=Lytechinus pictus TaxID=7653 RepID=UPI0030B9B8AF